MDPRINSLHYRHLEHLMRQGGRHRFPDRPRRGLMRNRNVIILASASILLGTVFGTLVAPLAFENRRVPREARQQVLRDLEGISW